MRKQIIIFSALLVFFTSCVTNSEDVLSRTKPARSEGKHNVIYHYNITIAPDLSNRIKKSKHIEDNVIINTVIDNIYPTILSYKRKMNQLDQFRVGFINQKQQSEYQINTSDLQIDFNKFKLQSQRINYLRDGGFIQEKNKLKQTLNKTYSQARRKNYGSDIWTFLEQGIDRSMVNLASKKSNTGNVKFKSEYRNVLILLTDGYIEANIYGKGYDLSGAKIAEFRKAFIKSKSSDILTFYKKNPNFHVKQITNPLIKNLEILVLELDDRSESNGGATIHPTDFEIMKIIWKEWLRSSGAKRVEVYPKFPDQKKAEVEILNFLGVR